MLQALVGFAVPSVGHSLVHLSTKECCGPLDCRLMQSSTQKVCLVRAERHSSYSCPCRRRTNHRADGFDVLLYLFPDDGYTAHTIFCSACHVRTAASRRTTSQRQVPCRWSAWGQRSGPWVSERLPRRPDLTAAAAAGAAAAHVTTGHSGPQHDVARNRKCGGPGWRTSIQKTPHAH